jgi:hypothetical protein
MGSTQELLSRIRDLEIENMELKSKLDQYQSIFPATGGPSGSPGSSTGTAPSAASNESGNQRLRRTNRGVGISAEPAGANAANLLDQTFPTFKKQER